MKKLLAAMIVCLSAITGIAHAIPLDLYIISGQSMASGYNGVTEFGTMVADLNHYQPEYSVQRTDVPIYYAREIQNSNAYPARDDKWGYLEPIYGWNMTMFGPEVSFGQSMADGMPNSNIGIIKFAIGGQSLRTFFRPPSSGAVLDGYDGVLDLTGDGYDGILHTVNAALTSIDPMYEPRIKGFLWAQGESDSGSLANANQYEDLITNFINDLRVDLGVPDLPFVLAHVKNIAPWTYAYVINDAMDAAAETLGNVKTFSTDDLPVCGDPWSHYTAVGEITLGQRFADNFISFPGDMNDDKNVNNKDVAEFGDQWQQTDCSLCDGADLTGDGNVDFDDLLVVAESWLKDFAFIGHWEFEANGLDSSGYGNDATAMGSPAYNPTGHVDGSVVFNGTTDYFELQGFPCVIGKRSRTVEGWIKTTAGGEIMSWGSPTNGAKWKMHILDSPGVAGALQVDVWGGHVVGSTYLRDGAWHHIAAIVRNDGSPDADEIELYVDGKEEDYSDVLSMPINTGYEDLSRIGVYVAGSGGLYYFFDGEMDDMRLYDRALSANQMAAKNGWDGLLAHWPLDSNANDIGGDGHDGTEFGGMTYSAGKVGAGGAVLDGSDDYIQMVGYKGPSGNRSRTVAAWIKTSSTNPQEIVSWGDSGDSVRWKFQIVDGFGTAGALQLDVSNGRVVGSTNLRDGVWHHVAAVLEDDGTPNADEVRLYVDGNLEAISSSASMPVLTGNVNDVYIGGILGSSVVYNFNGMIDDVRVYGIALSQGQIEELASM